MRVSMQYTTIPEVSPVIKHSHFKSDCTMPRQASITKIGRKGYTCLGEEEKLLEFVKQLQSTKKSQTGHHKTLA